MFQKPSQSEKKMIILYKLFVLLLFFQTACVCTNESLVSQSHVSNVFSSASHAASDNRRRKSWLLYVVWFWELLLLPLLGERWPEPQPRPLLTNTQNRFTFPVSSYHGCNLLNVSTRCTVLYETVHTRCTGPEVFPHELLCCKRVVLQTVYLSVEYCQRYDVPKSGFLNDKDAKWHVTLF